ncbi:CRISPR-associated ring nuclease Crn3/Csx3 [Trichothermofontia sp.]
MSAIELTVIPHQTEAGMPYQHLRFHLRTVDGNIEPADLKGLHLPTSIDCKQGVVIEGRGPIWLYGYLVHECHPAAWVGCYDPRLGAVVVASHTHAVQVGEVLPIALPPTV